MDNLVRVRQVPSQIVKVQRRIWLLQVAFWPAVTLGSIVAVVAVAKLISRRHREAVVVDDVTAASPARANGQVAAAPE
jgi:hypothetical protein